MTDLTDRQRRVLEFIQTYIKMKGFAPSMQDVATGMGLKSRSNIHRIVRYLEDNGLLTTVPHKFRTIKIRERSVEKMLSA